MADLQNEWYLGRQHDEQREITGPFTLREIPGLVLQQSRGGARSGAAGGGEGVGGNQLSSFLLWHPSFPRNEWKPLKEVGGAVGVWCLVRGFRKASLIPSPPIQTHRCCAA